MSGLDPFRLGVDLASALEDAGLPCALGGAIALAAWGIPRATMDVDINVFVEDDRLEAVFDALESVLGHDIGRQAARGAHERDGMFVLHADDGMRIDVFTPSIEFSWEAQERVERLPILGSVVPVLSAESLAVFKLLFFRSKDIADLERLVATQRGRLDVGYVRRWMVEMMGEDDARVVKWDELVRDFG